MKRMLMAVPLVVMTLSLQGATLDQRIRAIAAKSNGIEGVAALNVENGWHYELRSDERFPMGSVFKYPLAVEVLHQVDSGRLKLATEYTLTPHDYRPGYSPIAEKAAGKPVTLTLQQLLEASAGSSDNSAADFLLRLVGGPSVVTARMRQLGIAGVRVDRSEGEMALDLWSVTKRLPMEQWTLEMFQRLRKKATAGEISRGTAAYASDPRDTATPAAMRDLLLKTLQQKLGLSSSSNELLIGIMERSPTGAKRVRSILPPGARWAHKTGTMPGTSNDGGIITLSNGKHLIVVVFVRAGSLQGEALRDQTIAAIAKELIAAAR